MLQVSSNIKLQNKNPGACFYIVYLIIALATLAPAQTLKFERYTTADGLISDENFNLYQDQSGYVWIFSKYGAIKYDGNTFKRVLKNLPLREAFIYSMYERADGRKWFANSNAKIFQVKNDSAFEVSGLKEASKVLNEHMSEISRLYVDDHENIYAITKGLCFKLVKSKNAYIAQNLSYSFPADSILYMIDDNGDYAFLSNNKKVINSSPHGDMKSGTYIAIKNGKTQTIVKNRLPELNLTNPYHTLRNLRKYDDGYYAMISNGLVRFSKEGEVSAFLLPEIILCFTRDRLGHFWVGCLTGGIFELSASGEILSHYLDKATVSDILIDHQNGLWVSTQGLGLYHCVNTQALGFKDDSPLGTTITEMKVMDGVLYLGNADGDVASVAGNSITFLRSGRNRQIKSIEKYRDKIIVAALEGEIKDLLSGENIIKGTGYSTFLQLHAAGDTLIAMNRQTINYVVGGSLRKSIFYKGRIRCLGIAGDKIWIGTSNGVFYESTNYKIEGKKVGGNVIADTIVKLNKPDFLGPLKDEDIANIHVDYEKNTWFCSQGAGLYCIVGNRLLSYNVKNGLPDEIVNHVFRTRDMILLSASSGLYISKSWSPEKGFAPWTKICKGSVERALYFEEKIYAATSEGLVIFDYKDQFMANEDIVINLSSVRVNFKERNLDGFLQVNSSEKSLEFNFDVVNFTGSDPALDYILKGRQTDSIRTDNASYRLTQLIPGNYTLTVKNPVNNGNDGISIPFYVQPQFWETMFFRISLSIVILLSLAATVISIIRRNKRKQLIKAQNEQLILEYKLIALKAQVNPHFMSNCLSAIQDLIMSNQNDKATYYIAEFGLMVRQILDYSSKQLISLEEELNLVTIYIELEKLRFDNKFVFKLEINPGIEASEIMVPPLILNPLIENAIWHGLLPVQNERIAQLHVRVGRSDEQLKISIIDNGAGRSTKKTKISNSKNASYGLKITEQRMTNLNYLYKSNTASIVYLDLFDENNNPCGTNVTITMPINLANHENA